MKRKNPDRVKGGVARAKSLSKAKRRKIASVGGKAGGRGRGKNKRTA